MWRKAGWLTRPRCNQAHVLCTVITHAGEFVVAKGFKDATSSDCAEDADESSLSGADESSSSGADESSVNETFGFVGNESTESDAPEYAPIDMLHISRRRPDFGVLGGDELQPDLPPRTQYRDIASVQTLWREYAATAGGMFPKNLWRILRSVQKESKVTQANVLKACTSFLTRGERKNWPLTRKKVNDTLSRLATGHVHTTYTHNMLTRRAHTTCTHNMLTRHTSSEHTICTHDMHTRHAHTI